MPGKLIVDEIEDSGGSSVIGRKNFIINGNFDIWQRGTSFTATGYHADRWNAIVSGTGTTTISQQSFTLGQTDVPNEPKYYLRIAKSSGATSGDYLSSKNESVRTFAGQATAISFYAKASASTTLTPTIRQNFGTGGSPSSVNDAVKSDISVTTSWQKFTITHTCDSISGKTLGTNGNDHIELFFNIQNAAGDSIDFAQFQWEKGSVATEFEVRPIGEELELCQRYYVKSYNQSTAPGTASTTTGCINYITHANSSNGDRSTIFFLQTMRTTPTVTLYSTATGASGKIRIENTSTDIDGTAYYIGESTSNYYLNGTQTTGHNALLQYQADAEL